MKYPRGLTMRLTLWVAAACLLYAILGLALGWRDFSAGLQGVPLRCYGPLLVFALANYLLRYLRWDIYLKMLGVAVPRHESAALYFATYAMVVTPAKLGEIYKAIQLRDRRGVALGRGLAILVAERLYDFLAVLILAAAGAFAWQGPYAGPWLATGGVVMVLLALGGLSAGRLQRALVARIARIPYLVRHGVGVRDVLDDLTALAGGWTAVWSISLSVVAWACECLSLWYICRVLAMPVDFLTAIFIYATATLAGALAFLPGGLGGTEAVLILLLTRVGVVTGAAVSVSVVLRLMTLWLAVGIGVAVFVAARRILWGGGDSVVEPIDDQYD